MITDLFVNLNYVKLFNFTFLNLILQFDIIIDLIHLFFSIFETEYFTIFNILFSN